MPLIKQFTVKIYDNDGLTILKTLKPNEINNTLSFSNRINAGVGQLAFDLQLPYNDFDEGNSINYGNIVRVYVSEEDNPNGRLVYTGFMYKYEPYILAGKEGVKIYMLGLISLLKWEFYKVGASYTVAKNDTVSNIMKAIIDYYNTQVTHNLISYTASSIETLATTIDYEFVDRTIFDSLNDTFKNADGGWWWFIDKDGVVNLKAKPASATHSFTIGKDVESAVVGKDSTDLINSVQLRYASGDVDASDATSITNYGRRQSLINNDQAQDATAATQEAQKFVDDNKDPKIQANLTINSNYDLETIQPGDTCRVQNYKGTGQLFDENMQIVSLTYSLQKVTLQLEGFSGNFARELDKFVNG